MYLGTLAKMSLTHLFYSLLISECISEENDELVILEESLWHLVKIQYIKNQGKMLFRNNKNKSTKV